MGNKASKKDEAMRKEKDQQVRGKNAPPSPKNNKATSKPKSQGHTSANQKKEKEKSKKQKAKLDSYKEPKSDRTKVKTEMPKNNAKLDPKLCATNDVKKGKDSLKVSKPEQSLPKKEKKSLNSKNDKKEKDKPDLKSKRPKSKAPKQELVEPNIKAHKIYNKFEPKGKKSGLELTFEKSIISAKSIQGSKKSTAHKPATILDRKQGEDAKLKGTGTIATDKTNQGKKSQTVTNDMMCIAPQITKNAPPGKSAGVQTKSLPTEIELSTSNLKSFDLKTDCDLVGKSSEGSKRLEENSNDERSNPIFKEEFEHLYEKLKELNRANLILKESYRNLIRSLVKLNKQPNHDQAATQKITNMLTSISDLKSSSDNAAYDTLKKNQDTSTTFKGGVEPSKCDLSEEAVVIDPRFAMQRFLDPRTREDTFRDLFAEVDSLKSGLSKLEELFDSDGDFMIQDYLNGDYRISRSTFDSARQKTQMLLTIMQQVTRSYNQDLLDLFRIN